MFLNTLSYHSHPCWFVAETIVLVPDSFGADDYPKPNTQAFGTNLAISISGKDDDNNVSETSVRDADAMLFEELYFPSTPSPEACGAEHEKAMP